MLIKSREYDLKSLNEFKRHFLTWTISKENSKNLQKCVKLSIYSARPPKTSKYSETDINLPKSQFIKILRFLLKWKQKLIYIKCFKDIRIKLII